MPPDPHNPQAQPKAEFIVIESAAGYHRLQTVYHEPIALIMAALALVPKEDQKPLLLKIAATLAAVAIAVMIWKFHSAVPERPIADVPTRRVP